MDNLYTVSKPTHGSQEWLKVRWKDEQGRARISASVASSIHGANKYTSLADLCTELLAKEPPKPKEINAAMDRGNRLEPVILEWFAELEGIKVTTPDVMYAFCTEDGAVRLIATLDGMTEDGTPVEVKTTTRKWDGKLPEMWYWQGVQQAICTGTNKIEWAVFDSAQELHRYTQTVTSDEMATHINACRAVLSCIDADDFPEWVMLDYKHAEELNPNSSTKSVELPDGSAILFEQLDKLKSMKSAVEEQESKLKAQIGMFLEDADTGTIDGKKVVTWKTQTRDSFDMKRFESEHPALVEKYRKQTTFRVMRFI